MAGKVEVKKTGVEEKVEDKIESYCQKLKEKLPQLSVNQKPVEIRTPILTGYGEIKVTIFKTKSGQKRYGVTLKPEGGHPIYNRMLITSYNELRFLREIAENIGAIERIAKVIAELNESEEYSEILEGFEF